MSGKVLVAYATRCGSTAEVAEEVGRVLRESEIDADVRSVDEVADLDGYRAAVIGSAVRGGKWLPEATRLVEAQRWALSGMPVAYFVVGRALRKGTAEGRGRAAACLDAIRARVPEVVPASIGLFAGKLDAAGFSPLIRLAMRLDGTEFGDWRDWPAVRTWAKSLARSLAVEAREQPVGRTQA